MIKSYIYGAPCGFDVYGEHIGLNEYQYLRGFFDTTRNGTWFIVNHVNDDTTIYSYLRYGIYEQRNRHKTAFFGISLVADSTEWRPDHNVLQEWFEFLFRKLAEQHHVFDEDENGELYYTINRFAECQSGMGWITSMLKECNLRRVIPGGKGTDKKQATGKN